MGWSRAGVRVTLGVAVAIALLVPAAPVLARPAPAAGPDMTTGTAVQVPRATVARVTRDDVRVTWSRGCPVHWRDLRAVRMSFWTEDESVRRGTLIVHRSVVADVVAAFAKGFRTGFVLERMRPAEAYRGDDDRSMAANNTSAFSCRTTADGTARYSRHAWGDAVDINPVQNPFLYRGSTYPPAGAPYADRGIDHPGMLRADTPILRVFVNRGWRWGGQWSDPDYQHVSQIRPDEPDSQ